MKPKNRNAAPPFHRWRGIPKELPRELYHVSHYARATALDLYRIADEYDGKIETRGGRWDVSLCCTMQVPGPDRRNACRALGQLKESGVIRVFDGFVVVCLGQSLDGLPAHTKADSLGLQSDSLGFHSDSSRIPLGFDSESSTRNQLIHVPENRTEQIKEQREREREERARPDLVGFNWYCHTLNLLPTSAPSPGSWREQYAYMGSKPEAERAKVAAEIQADTWCTTNPHRVTPEHVKKNWNVYLGGETRPVLKAVAPVKPTGIWAKAVAP